MKSYIYAIASIVLVSACAKNEGSVNETVQSGNVVVLHASLNEQDTKATVDGTTGAFSWTKDADLIAVHASDGKYHASEGASASTNDATFTVDLGGGTGDAFAVYPSTIVSTTAANYGQVGTALDVTLPSSYALAAVQGDKTPLPMIATYGAELSFSHLCALLRLTIYNLPSTTSYIKLDFNGKKVWGDFSVASPVTPGTSVIAAADDDSHDTITITDLGIIAWTDNIVVNLPIPVGEEYTTVQVTAYDSSDNVLLTMTRPIKVSANWTPARAKGRKVSAALPAFSVSASKHVIIARSNLKCTTDDDWTTWSFSFMTNSWSTIEGTSNDNRSGQTAIGMFAWGTSGCTTMGNYGANTAPNSTEYGGDDAVLAKYGPTDGTMSLTAEHANGDWGVFNAIGTDPAGTWRLLTNTECVYLFGRSSKNLEGLAKVNTDGTTVNGLIILPDNFADPTGKFVGANTDISSNNNFTTAEWAVMEAAGAAFLPSAGLFWSSGSEVSAKNTRASYWTSSANGGCVGFETGYDSRYTLPVAVTRIKCGLSSVRLVREID